MGAFAALDQRIAIRHALTPMDLGESAQYLRHLLALVGRSDPLFADDAVARLHRVANGLPRTLNNAATAALIAAAADGKELVDDHSAKRAAPPDHSARTRCYTARHDAHRQPALDDWFRLTQSCHYMVKQRER